MPDYPDITIDEYGRTYCAAHRRQECPICCMSFVTMNEEVDENPSDRDVGVFISDASLIEWYAKMKMKIPRLFRRDNVFGNDTSQYKYGTRLAGSLGDATVVGSRWITQEFSLCDGDDLEPVYVILFGSGELTQTLLTDAHMGEWRVVGQSPEVNARLDALARAHRIHQAAHHEEEDSDIESDIEELNDDIATLPLQALNRRICRTLKNLHNEDFEAEPWNESAHGIFLRQFSMFSFSFSERDQIFGSSALQDNTEITGNKIQAFPIAMPKNLEPDQKNFYARIVMAKMVAFYAIDHYGAIILQNERGTKFQAIEFNSCHVSNDGVPCIDISYATDPEGIEHPKIYLRGEKIKIVEVSNELAIELEAHLLNCVSSKGLNDLGSGLLYHEGFFVPMEIRPWNGSNHGANANIANNPSIPEINFGVELELSCASGNYQKRTALSLQKHAKVDVRIGRPSGKGGKGGSSGYQKGFTKGSSSGSSNKWKLVYDQSITPNVQNPQSLMFELVSPILTGRQGLDVLSKTVSVMADVACIRVNDSMGLHVHVEAKEEHYSLENLKSICQQFILFEDVIDSFLPYHRRTGSEKCHSFFESNVISMMDSHETLQGSIKAIFSCDSRDDLYCLMNPGFRERYHKMNLQNLKTGRQPTVEFRQHHATKDEKEIEAWVRFCVLFVVNAAMLPPVPDYHMSTDEDGMFDLLFQNIIRCPVLQGYYSKKRAGFKNRE